MREEYLEYIKKREFPFKISTFLKHKLDRMISLLKKEDAWIIIDGDEGSGKTNASAYILYYFSCMTGRNLLINNFYFDSDKLLQFAQHNKDMLINWDEGAIGGLSVQWWSETQRNLLQFAMLGRKNHHVFTICIPKIFKLTEYLKLDRSLCLIHMDRGKRKDRYGDAIYINRRGKQELLRVWTKKKVKAYSKYGSFGYGGFKFHIPEVFTKIFTEEEQQQYENSKTDTIKNIGVKKEGQANTKLKYLKYKLATIEYPVKSMRELAKKLGYNQSTVSSWNKNQDFSENSLRNEVLTDDLTQNISNIHQNQDENEVIVE